MSKKIQEAIDNHLQKAEDLIWHLVEREVKAVLQDPNIKATGFISAMGGYFWIYDPQDGSGAIDIEDDSHDWQKPIDAIYDAYGDMFKLYGAGVRWDLLDGKVLKLTNW